MQVSILRLVTIKKIFICLKIINVQKRTNNQRKKNDSLLASTFTISLFFIKNAFQNIFFIRLIKTLSILSCHPYNSRKSQTKQ